MRREKEQRKGANRDSATKRDGSIYNSSDHTGWTHKTLLTKRSQPFSPFGYNDEGLNNRDRRVGGADFRDLEVGVQIR